MNIQEPHTTQVLKEMCKRVGADYDTIDFSQDGWYLDHEWTIDEEKDFINWLADKMVKWKYVSKKGFGKYTPKYQAEKAIWGYSWKYSV